MTRAKTPITGAVLFCLLVAACFPTNCHQAKATVVSGPLDLVSAQRESGLNPSCDCTDCIVPCKGFDLIAIGPDGVGVSDKLFGGVQYLFMSGLAAAIADVTTPCNGDFTVSLSPPANPAPQGTITISGPGVGCKKVYDAGCNCFFIICNTTTISLTLNGFTVSTTAATTSVTASSVAGDLATKINTGPNLGPMFAAAAFANVVQVQARQAAIEYPW